MADESAANNKKFLRCLDLRVASQLGTNAAFVLNGIEYLSKNNINSKTINGVDWVPITYDDLHNWFPFISVISIKRAVKLLASENLIRVDHFSGDTHKNTNWYSLGDGKNTTHDNETVSNCTHIGDQIDTQTGSVYILNRKNNSSATSADQNDTLEKKEPMTKDSETIINEFDPLDDEHLKAPLAKLTKYSQKRLLNDFGWIGIEWLKTMIKDAYEYHFEGNKRKPKSFALAVRNWIKLDKTYARHIAQRDEGLIEQKRLEDLKKIFGV